MHLSQLRGEMLLCSSAPPAPLTVCSLVESTADSPAHDAANFTWQGVVTAAQCCSTLPSVALQQLSSSAPAPTMHPRIINLNTCKREMSHFITLRVFVRHLRSAALCWTLFTIQMQQIWSVCMCRGGTERQFIHVMNNETFSAQSGCFHAELVSRTFAGICAQ